MEIDRELLIQIFVTESKDHLREMEEALLALESQPDDPDFIQTVFRIAHTIKGSASCVGLNAISDFTHIVEDFLDKLRGGEFPVTGSMISHLLTVKDTIHEMVLDAGDGVEEFNPKHLELLAELSKYAETTDAVVEPGSFQPEETVGERARENQSWADRARTLRVDVEKLDRMLNQTGEIAIAQGRLRQLLQNLNGQESQQVLEAHLEIEALYMDLQELVMTARMAPVGPTFRQYFRTVRDLALIHGKSARLIIEGDEVEVDIKVIEMLKDPLTHLIRNAVDHGIESFAVRRDSGKKSQGSLTLRAMHESGSIIIQLSDDGAGMRRAEILARARERGLITDMRTPTDEELYGFVFTPGFSTKAGVTELSGRGVGLDVVRANVEALRGTVAIESEEGVGTTITVRVPLTLAIIDGFSVGVGDETYVIPMDTVVECLELCDQDTKLEQRSGVLNLRGQAIPYLRLRDAFGLGGKPSSRENIVVIQDGSGRAGIVVDTLYGKQQTVIKPLGKLLGRGLRGITGSAILGSGRVALILDAARILRDAVVSQSPAMASE